MGKNVSGREIHGDQLESLPCLAASMLIGAWLMAILAGENDLIVPLFSVI